MKKSVRAPFPTHPEVLLRVLFKAIWRGVKEIPYWLAVIFLFWAFLGGIWTHRENWYELVGGLLSITIGQILLGIIVIGLSFLFYALIGWFLSLFDDHHNY